MSFKVCKIKFKKRWTEGFYDNQITFLILNTWIWGVGMSDKPIHESLQKEH